MKSTAGFSIALLCLALGMAPAAPESRDTAAKPDGGMSMMDRMGRSHACCMSDSLETLDSLSKAVGAAIKSGKKEEMKAALQRTEAYLDRMKKHKASCMEMKERKMGGGGMGKGMGKGMGMGMGGGPTGGDTSKPKPAEPAAGHDHHPK